MKILDLHVCIQGEGKFAGVPHILLRLSGCNLTCMFSETICDTAYASWYPEKESKFIMSDVSKIINENPQIEWVLLTGGEPTINPAKVTDPRAKDYILEHGNTSWEVDALKPEVLHELLENSILKYIDKGKFDAIVSQEEAKVVNLKSSLV